jgi:hypothetical protein
LSATCTTAARSFRAISSIALLAVLAAAVACGGSSSLEPRYRNFSAQDAALETADLPDGWRILDSEDLPTLEQFLPEDVELIDSVLTIGATAEDDPSAVQFAAVGIGLLGGEEEQEGEQGLAGLALRGAMGIELSEINFVSARPVDLPRPGSTRLQYSTLSPTIGPALITEAINIRDGRIIVDVEIVHPLGVEPSLDLEELAADVYARIAQQLVEE